MFHVKKLDEDKRIACGEVYAPGILDSHGAIMLSEDIELMAHRFMQLQLSDCIDTNHNNLGNGAIPVESFIARAGDPDYTEGAWVLAVKVHDDEVWQSIKKGELNGFSLEAWVTKKAVVAVLDVSPEIIGETEISNDHTHLFFAELDDDGKVRFGRTSTTNGHSHDICKASATEISEGHSHRIFV